jgi:hypothetical protein
MAKGTKTGGRDFKKGNKMGGRKPHPPEVRKAAKLTKEQFLANLGEFSNLTVSELKELVKNDDLPAMQAWVANVFLMGIIEADHVRLNFVADRLFGKVTDKVEVKMPAPMVIERPSGAQFVLGHQDKKMIDVTPKKEKEDA